MKQKYYHYTKWEDFNNGFFDTDQKENQNELIERSKTILSNSNLFYQHGILMVENWQISSLVNLTNNDINKRAWIGQSTCCFSHNSPSILTRLAWNKLTPKEQKQANLIADKIYNYWINQKTKNHVKTLFENECI